MKSPRLVHPGLDLDPDDPQGSGQGRAGAGRVGDLSPGGRSRLPPAGGAPLFPFDLRGGSGLQLRIPGKEG